MKKIFLSATITLLITLSTKAQWAGGGFGNFVAGPAYNICSRLQQDLQSPQLFGGNLQINASSISIGGAGYSIRPRKIILGGSGYAYTISETNNSGELQFQASAGFFNM